VFIPVARDELVRGLIEGRGDIAAAGLTITPDRDEVIDFTNPVSRELSEVLVTGPSAPAIESIEDLAGQEVYVRASSSYRSSLDALNRRLGELGKPQIVLRDVAESLEDEDLLDMVNAGLLPWAVVDDYKAESWAEVFEGIVVRKDLVLRTGGRVGYAVRENSPLLLTALNDFLNTHKEGSLTGNILINRYIRDFDWSGNALAVEDYKRFEEVVDTFELYGKQYGMDYLLITAQGYQESRLDQSVRSKAGAVGIMQLLPSTAQDPNVGIPDITEAENNIHAGIRYLDFIRTRYFDDPGIDRYNQTLFALASYNAGPARIRSLREKAEAQGYDPNRWFDNVELVAAREVGTEPVTYVANIVKYYVAYSLSVARLEQREGERQRLKPDG
jgi:membrane-bound lytic murein transglycosylase MltF